MSIDVDELVPFLTNARSDVRRQAVTLLAALGQEEKHHEVLQRAGAVKPLCKLLGDDDKGIAELAAKTLVNLSMSECVQADLRGPCKAVDRLMDLLRDDDRAESHAFHLMALANISRSPEGGRAVLQAGQAIEGLHLMRLVQLFVERDNDRYDSVAHIITNVSQIAAGRRLLADPAKGILKKLAPSLLSDNPTRRLGVLRAVRNCCMVEEHQRYLLSNEAGILWRLYLPLVGPEELPEEELAGMLPQVIRAMTPDKERERDSETRRLICETFMACARYREARSRVRDTGAVAILRELHIWERDVAHNDEQYELLDKLVPICIMKEAEEGSEEAAKVAEAEAAAAAAEAAEAPAPAPQDGPKNEVVEDDVAE